MHSSFQRLVVIAVAALVVLLTENLGATVWCVNLDGSGGCDTLINAAIAKASAGDTVFVWDGIYRENVVINKRILVMGAGHQTTKIIPESGNSVTLASGYSQTVLSGLALTAPGGTGIYSPLLVGDLTLRNCAITHCTGWGILVDGGSSVNRQIFVKSCLIDQNGRDGIQFTNGSIYVFNSVISGNNGYPLHIIGSTAYFADHCCAYGNTYNSLSGEGNLLVDPQFVDPVAGNYHLQPGSPCIDAGRPGTAYEDCDGTRNDMGVYGGPDAVCGPGPSVTELQIVPATVVKGQSFKVQAKAKTK